MGDDKLAQFSGHKYLNLETYRRSGQAMPTPVWFVEESGTLYVRTGANSGKVKRIRNNPRVRVAPCTVSGEPLGEWIEGQAGVVKEDAIIKQVDKLLSRKYGLTKWAFQLMSLLQGHKYDVLKVQI
jgi:hypothetical protein